MLSPERACLGVSRGDFEVLEHCQGSVPVEGKRKRACQSERQCLQGVYYHSTWPTCAVNFELSGLDCLPYLVSLFLKKKRELSKDNIQITLRLCFCVFLVGQ